VTIDIRLFTSNDVSMALELCRAAGWNQLYQDWSRLIEYEPQGCFAAEVQGKLVGTATTTRYGRDMAWIGMMLVHQDLRRRGIATRLVNACLDHLRARRVRCIKLDATPAGRPVYERLGFRAQWSFHRWACDTMNKDAHSTCVAAAGFAGSTYADLDHLAFGADRSAWLERLAEGSDLCLRPQGFGMLRSGCLASYLGPLTAENHDVAGEIVADLLRRSARGVFWDIPQPNANAVALAESLGFKPVRDLTRMWAGSELIEPNLNLQFALSDPGTG
jgi:GNAT superfamily N-acetyltransferase